VNVILVPALLLLIGLVVYKKVVEPRRAGASAKPGKPGKAPKRGHEPTPAKAPKAKARQAVNSSRMGSVL
jgi:hypothetical protein